MGEEKWNTGLEKIAKDDPGGGVGGPDDVEVSTEQGHDQQNPLDWHGYFRWEKAVLKNLRFFVTNQRWACLIKYRR